MSIKTRSIKLGLCTLIISISLIAPFAGLAQSAAPQYKESVVSLVDIDWIHGAADCASLKNDPGYHEWQPVQYSANTWIFRQNKCSNYEAPFVYLFLGSASGLMIDTGATVEGGSELLAQVRHISDLPITVAHSHGHGDHRLGDETFRKADNFSLVEVGQPAVEEYFGFENWPYEIVTIDLGGRDIAMLPIPGHSDDDLAFYDAVTETLVTGDSLYPGRLYVRNWPGYRDSITRLAEWISDKPITNVLGTHIEMSTEPDVDYPVETTYQPEEHPLPLKVNDILRLRDAMQEHDSPERVYLGSFIIWPV